MDPLAWLPPSTPGLLFALLAFLASFGPSLLPRGWAGQGFISGVSASLAYLVGLVFELAAGFLMGLIGLRVQVTRTATGGDLVLWLLAIAGLVGFWAWANRQHDLTAELVGLPDHPWWFDVLATLLGVVVFGGVVGLVHALWWLNGTLTSGLQVVLPSVLAVIGGVLLSLVLVAIVNVALFRQAIEWLSRAADKANQRSLRGLTRPTSALRSGSGHGGQTWEQLGRRGQIFAACGPDAAAIEGVTGTPALEPVRVYAGFDTDLDTSVAVALAELRRTGAFDRAHLCIAVPAGRGWVNEFTVQGFEYLTGGDCATVAVQYTHLASAFALIANPDTPRAAARAVLTAVEEELADRPREHRPRLYLTGESLGSYAGHGAFADTDDMLDRVQGALWIGTPGFTEIWQALTRARQRGSPEITPVISNGARIRFASRPQELHEDAYGRPLGQWKQPRVAYLQHASDPMVWWNPRLAFREPDWMREQAGRDVNPHLRWWPIVTWFQILIDQLTSLDTPPGHGHIYEDDVVAVWAGVLDRQGAPVDRIVAAIRTATEGLGTASA